MQDEDKLAIMRQDRKWLIRAVKLKLDCKSVGTNAKLYIKFV